MTDSTYLRDTIAAALAAQPWYMRRKDTLAAIAGSILHALNFSVVATTETPWWVALIISGIVAACQIVIHAATPGAITPSMDKRLEPFAVGRVEFRTEEPAMYTRDQVVEIVRRLAEPPTPQPQPQPQPIPPAGYDELGMPIYSFGPAEA